MANLPEVKDDQLQSVLSDSMGTEAGLKIADDCFSILTHNGIVSARGGASA